MIFWIKIYFKLEFKIYFIILSYSYDGNSKFRHINTQYIWKKSQKSNLSLDNKNLKWGKYHYEIQSGP